MIKVRNPEHARRACMLHSPETVAYAEGFIHGYKDVIRNPYRNSCYGNEGLSALYEEGWLAGAEYAENERGSVHDKG